VGAGRVRLIAWVLWLASLALVALGLLFLGLGASTPVPPGFGFRGVNVVFSVAFSTVGAVLTLRRPDEDGPSVVGFGWGLVVDHTVRR
jgi:hypothetical protein